MSDKPLTPAMVRELWKRCPGRVKRVALAAGAAAFAVLLIAVLFGGSAALPIGLACMLGVVMAMAREIERIRQELDREKKNG